MLATPILGKYTTNNPMEYYTFRVMVPCDTPSTFMDEYPWINWRVMDREYDIPFNFDEYTNLMPQKGQALYLQHTRRLWMHSCYVMWYANIVILLAMDDDAIFDSIKHRYKHQKVYWFSLTRHEWFLYKNGIWSATAKPSLKRFNKDPYITTIGLVAPWGSSSDQAEDGIVYQSVFSNILN